MADSMYRTEAKGLCFVAHTTSFRMRTFRTHHSDRRLCRSQLHFACGMLRLDGRIEHLADADRRIKKGWQEVCGAVIAIHLTAIEASIEIALIVNAKFSNGGRNNGLHFHVRSQVGSLSKVK